VFTPYTKIWKILTGNKERKEELGENLRKRFEGEEEMRGRERIEKKNGNEV